MYGYTSCSYSRQSMKRDVLFLAFCAFLTACQVEYLPYDTRGPTGINARNVARIEAACEGRIMAGIIWQA